MNNPAQCEKISSDLLLKVDPDGKLRIASCLQCGRCSSGCTMRNETDILPHQLNRMVVLGLEDRVLNSRAIWACASCQTCVSRCPMKVNTPAMIDALKIMTTSAPEDLHRVKVFNDVMHKSIRKFGRVYEFGMMAEYKIKTRDFFSDIFKFPKMLLKGKMRILPPKTSGKNAVSGIFGKVLPARRAK